MAVIFPSISPENCMNAASSNFPQFLTTMPGGAVRSALAFDSAVSEECRTPPFIMPPFTAPLVLKVKFVHSATSGNVQFRAAIEAITDADAQNLSTTSSFDTANSSGSIAVPASTFTQKEFSITLTNNDSITAGDNVTIRLNRDVTVSLATDCYVLVMSLEDAS